MTTLTNDGRWWRVTLVACVALASTSAAFADHRSGRDDGHHDDRHYAAPHEHFDTRYAHNHAYYDRGYVVRVRPVNGYAIDHGRNHYWYDRGVWYRQGRANWVVVGAPIGAFVTILPPFYSTVWFGGIPYYYANDTYYAWRANRNSYEVVEPPADIDAQGTTQAPASTTLYVYPKNGQSAEQQSKDRYECYRYAADQTGFDPTQSGGGVAADDAASKRSDYTRAETACLDARGYSVR
jgi:hypothetical protein